MTNGVFDDSAMLVMSPWAKCASWAGLIEVNSVSFTKRLKEPRQSPDHEGTADDRVWGPGSDSVAFPEDSACYCSASCRTGCTMVQSKLIRAIGQ